MNKRKSRPNNMSRPQQRVRSVTAEGVYKNAHFMHAIACHVGDVVQVHTQSDSRWEGVFITFSSNFEVVLELAHKMEGATTVGNIVEKMIFKPEDIISIKVKDSDLRYATKDSFQTDAAISKYNGRAAGLGEERDLQPWDGSETFSNGDGLGDSLEQLDELDHRANGWDANDMFRKNEQDYGVQSTFDQSLSGYTMQFQKKDTPEFRNAEAKAQEIANEIESQPTYKRRMELENGDEEDLYAAVQRPGPPPRHMRPSPPPSVSASGQNSMPANGGSVQAGDKYVPPNRRKNTQTGKLIKSPQVPLQQSPGVQSKGPHTVNAPPPVSQYPNLPHHPAHQPLHQQPVMHPMNVAKSYAAVGAAGMVNPAQPSHPAPFHTPPPASFIHGHPVQNNVQSMPGGGKVNGTDMGIKKAPPGGPLPQRTRHISSHQGHQAPAPFSVAVPPSISPQVVHPDAVNPQILSHQMVEQGHIGSTLIGGQVVAPQSIPIQTSIPGPQCHPRRQDEMDLRQFSKDFKLKTDGSVGNNLVNDPIHNIAKPPSGHQDVRDGSHKGSPMSEPQKLQGLNDQIPPKHNSQDLNNKTVSAHPEVSVTPQQPVSNTNQSSGEQHNTSAATDKVTTSIKKFTLNPNAKEFNPSAKPFIPRSPSTPNPSRPHTPGTPVGQAGPMGGPSQYVGGMGHHNMHHPAQHHLGSGTAVVVGGGATSGFATVVHHPPPGPTYQPSQSHHPHRLRKVPLGSQMQVANATGQPLLTPAPMTQFMPYAHTAHPHQPPPQYPHMVGINHYAATYWPGPQVRVYPHEGPGSGGPVQYLAAPPPPPSTPSPGQGYHPPPSPAVGPPPQQPPPQPFQPPFQMLCPIISQPHPIYLPQQPPPQPHQQQQHQIQVLIPPQQGGGQAPPQHGGQHQ